MKFSPLASLCLATCLAVPALAHEHEPQANDPHHAGDKHHHMKAMHHHMVKADWVEALKLDGEKAEKVRAIQEDYESDRKELHTEHMQAMRDLKREREKQLQGVLSAEELTVLQRMWEAHAMPKGAMNCPGE